MQLFFKVNILEENVKYENLYTVFKFDIDYNTGPTIMFLSLCSTPGFILFRNL